MANAVKESPRMASISENPDNDDAEHQAVGLNDIKLQLVAQSSILKLNDLKTRQTSGDEP